MSMVGTTELAIVIPAYKGAFLERTLASIAAQRDERFRVYVGDDASPEPIEKIVRQSNLSKDKLFYYKFDENVGGRSLVKHWERCIALSREPWVWLFSDDDMMEPGCVKTFYHALQHTEGRYDLYRFNTAIIDDEDRLMGLNPPHPEYETWNEFVYCFLNGWRFPNQQELIFSRKAFEKIGGFLDFPMAWWSDVAFAISCGRHTGIWTIRGPRVLFRKSRKNISSQRDKTIYRLKLKSMVGYFIWLCKFIEDNTGESYPDRPTLLGLVRGHFIQRLAARNAWLSWRECAVLIPFMRNYLGLTELESRVRCLYNNIGLLSKALKQASKKWIVGSMDA